MIKIYINLNQNDINHYTATLIDIPESVNSSLINNLNFEDISNIIYITFLTS